jgi:type VI secretion system protein ImpH
MARESQPARTGLTALNKDIWRVNFIVSASCWNRKIRTRPLGTAEKPSADPVRFRPWPGMGFPVSELRTVETDEDHPELPPRCAPRSSGCMA